jgi:hypothetical protein
MNCGRGHAQKIPAPASILNSRARPASRPRTSWPVKEVVIDPFVILQTRGPEFPEMFLGGLWVSVTLPAERPMRLGSQFSAVRSLSGFALFTQLGVVSESLFMKRSLVVCRKSKHRAALGARQLSANEIHKLSNRWGSANVVLIAEGGEPVRVNRLTTAQDRTGKSRTGDPKIWPCAAVGAASYPLRHCPTNIGSHRLQHDPQIRLSRLRRIGYRFWIPRTTPGKHPGV